MTLSKFVDHTLGTKVDFDGVYGAQCVDLFRQYCKDVWQIPHTGSVEGAKELFSQNDKNLLYITNGYGTVKSGDVIIWDGTSSNSYGHVAIALFATDMTVLVLEQNGFEQTGTKIVPRNYINCLGYIRKK